MSNTKELIILLFYSCRTSASNFYQPFWIGCFRSLHLPYHLSLSQHWLSSSQWNCTAETHAVHAAAAIALSVSTKLTLISSPGHWKEHSNCLYWLHCRQSWQPGFILARILTSVENGHRLCSSLSLSLLKWQYKRTFFSCSLLAPIMLCGLFVKYHEWTLRPN